MDCPLARRLDVHGPRDADEERRVGPQCVRWIAWAPRRFLLAAFEPDDAVAIFLKSYETGAVAQRVVSPATRDVRSVPGLAPGPERGAVEHLRQRQCGRRRAPLPGAGRHSRRPARVPGDRHATRVVFLAAIAGRQDLPQPTFLMRTSPGRAHVLWRVRGFSTSRVEALQKTLARELGRRHGGNVVFADHQDSRLLQSQAYRSHIS